MGAATSLLHADRDHSIAGVVLDSSFASLKQLAKELAARHTKIPNWILTAAMKIVKKSVKSRADFDLEKLNPIDNLDKAFIPALFGHAEGDMFIEKHHT